jgi:hypothetical protein
MKLFTIIIGDVALFSILYCLKNYTTNGIYWFGGFGGTLIGIAVLGLVVADNRIYSNTDLKSPYAMVENRATKSTICKMWDYMSDVGIILFGFIYCGMVYFPVMVFLLFACKIGYDDRFKKDMETKQNKTRNND